MCRRVFPAAFFFPFPSPLPLVKRTAFRYNVAGDCLNLLTNRSLWGPYLCEQASEEASPWGEAVTRSVTDEGKRRTSNIRQTKPVTIPLIRPLRGHLPPRGKALRYPSPQNRVTIQTTPQTPIYPETKPFSLLLFFSQTS